MQPERRLQGFHRTPRGVSLIRKDRYVETAIVQCEELRLRTGNGLHSFFSLSSKWQTPFPCSPGLRPGPMYIGSRCHLWQYGICDFHLVASRKQTVLIVCTACWSTCNFTCALVPRPITMVFGLRMRLHMCMRTKLKNGIWRNRQQFGSAVNHFINQGEFEVIETLNSHRALCCDKHQFHAKMTVST